MGARRRYPRKYTEAVRLVAARRVSMVQVARDLGCISTLCATGCGNSVRIPSTPFEAKG